MLWSSTNIQWGLQHGDISINPLRDGAIQPASVDLHLSDRPILVWEYNSGTPIDPMDDNSEAMVSRPLEDGQWLLRPGEFALASTIERIEIGATVAGRMEGKSSLARLGLVPHAAAGFFDPGFVGWPTLELVNFVPRAIILRPGMPIAQMSFIGMLSKPEHLYGEALGSKYQAQSADPQPSLYHRNTTGAST